MSKPTLLSDSFEKYKITLAGRTKYVKNDFQAYGLELADELGDWKHKSLYIRLAKTIDRKILDQARYFVKDQRNIQTPYKLFMWKLKELKNKQK
jgi:hypothetical protein